VETDSDSVMNSSRKSAFRLYENTGGNLEFIFLVVTNNDTQNFHCSAISDLLHFMTNARSRIATGTAMFIGVNERAIPGESITKIRERKHGSQRAFCAHKPLVLLKNDIALQAFTLTNLPALWEAQDMIGVHFLLPFVRLDLAIPNSRLCPDTRLGLLYTALSVFFSMWRDDRTTGRRAGISGRTPAGYSRKTLWTRVMCQRRCNLCVGLYWAVKKWGREAWEDFWLALNRIASHSCHWHFGTTRSTLSGDPRYNKFMTAEVTPALIHDVICAVGPRPFIRRFQEVAECTLAPGADNLISVEFDHIMEWIYEVFHAFKHTS
jgi:hypothetical protein